MPKPIKVGRKERMTFAKINEVCEMPNLIDIQTKSYQWFIEEGLGEVLEDISPIRDTTDTLNLEFVDYSFSDSKVGSGGVQGERDHILNFSYC